MAKNIMPDIAKLLGVEINEEFKICNAVTGKVANNITCILDNRIVARRPTDLIGVWYTLDAEDDVATTCIVYRLVLAAITQMPLDLVKVIAGLAPVEMWYSRILNIKNNIDT